MLDPVSCDKDVDTFDALDWPEGGAATFGIEKNRKADTCSRMNVEPDDVAFEKCSHDLVENLLTGESDP